MKASELIATLKKMVEENGDAEIYVETIDAERRDDGITTSIKYSYKCPNIAYYVPAYWNKIQRTYCIKGGATNFERRRVLIGSDNEDTRIETVDDILNVAQELAGIAQGLRFDFFILPRSTTDEMIRALSIRANDLHLISNHLIDLMNILIGSKE